MRLIWGDKIRTFALEKEFSQHRNIYILEVLLIKTNMKKEWNVSSNKFDASAIPSTNILKLYSYWRVMRNLKSYFLQWNLHGPLYDTMVFIGSYNSFGVIGIYYSISYLIKHKYRKPAIFTVYTFIHNYII